MDANEKFEYWLDIAEYDLNVAESMYNAGHWLYVTFMCQQAIEKLVKGLYNLYVDDNIPRIHNIKFVIKKYSDKLPEEITEEQNRFFDKLTAFYLEGRYPEYIHRLSELVKKAEADEILKKSKEIFTWLMTMKP